MGNPIEKTGVFLHWHFRQVWVYCFINTLSLRKFHPSYLFSSEGLPQETNHIVDVIYHDSYMIYPLYYLQTPLYGR
jgi:hypothetical protein